MLCDYIISKFPRQITHRYILIYLLIRNVHTFIQQNMYFINPKKYMHSWRRRGRMVVGFTTTCAIIAYHH